MWLPVGICIFVLQAFQFQSGQAGTFCENPGMVFTSQTCFRLTSSPIKWDNAKNTCSEEPGFSLANVGGYQNSLQVLYQRDYKQVYWVNVNRYFNQRVWADTVVLVESHWWTPGHPVASLECTALDMNTKKLVSTACSTSLLAMCMAQQCSPMCGGDEGICDTETQLCRDGCTSWFTGANCSQECSKHCGGDRKCFQFTASCLNGCEKGFHGHRCVTACSSNCLEGDCYFGNGTCKKCPPGIYGQICTSECPAECDSLPCHIITGQCLKFCNDAEWYLECPVECPKTCGRNGECHASNGTCVHGCTPGWYLADCSEKCPDNCGGNTSCGLQNGYCLEGCRYTHYGRNCSIECPSHCGVDGSCHEETGFCSKGCVPGHFGKKCSNACGNCAGVGACHQENAFCVAGCLPGYIGQRCDVRPYIKYTDYSAVYAFGIVVVCTVLAVLVTASVRALLIKHQKRPVLQRFRITY